MTQHWQINDEDRAAHPAPATYNPDGTRQHTPMPDPADRLTNFGRPYEEQNG